MQFLDRTGVGTLWSMCKTKFALKDHSHNYLPLSGGTLTGDLLFSNSGTTFRQIRGTCGDNDFWRIGGGATRSNAGYMEIATAYDGTEPIYVRQYYGTFGTITRTATLLDDSGNTSFPGTVAAAKFKGALEGNASTASNAATVNGHTVNANVPANAKFTDTNTWRGIQDNLTSSSTSESLSANQGKILKGLIDSKANSVDLDDYTQKYQALHRVWFEGGGDGKQYLRTEFADGTAIGSDVLENADSNTDGCMSKEDKVKLDGIESGANNYTLPVATVDTLGGILSYPILGSSIDLWPITVSIQAVAYTNIPGLKKANDGGIKSIRIKDGEAYTEYGPSIIVVNDGYGEISNISMPSNSGTLALVENVPNASKLCSFNFINSISECKIDRINFLFRCPDTLINLDPFDAYPNGAILLISISENSANIKHQSGRWYFNGESYNKSQTVYASRNQIILVTKNKGELHCYDL